MHKYSKFIAAALTAASILVLAAGCGSSSTASKPLKVGVTAGPHAEIMDEVKKVAAKDGLNIEVVEFNDYIQPNMALAQGDIDANSYQHQPYLDQMVKDRNLPLVSVAKTIIAPMGVYSKKVKNLNDLPQGATIAIPNDPTNGGRALLLLQKQGLITLKAGTSANTATPQDIVSNPKNLQIKELDAAQIPRSLADVDAAAINTNFALNAGLMPSKDALALEDANSPYANVIAVRQQDKDNPAIQKLIKAYHDPEIKKFIEAHFQGAFLPAW